MIINLVMCFTSVLKKPFMKGYVSYIIHAFIRLTVSVNYFKKFIPISYMEFVIFLQ